MIGFEFEKAREYLHQFRFGELFIQLLGWENPNMIHPISINYEGQDFNAKPISHLSGVAVFEVSSVDQTIPSKTARNYIQLRISKLHHENLVIFLDHERTQSLWLWVKKENKKLIPREHSYMKGQPGDLFVSKLAAMFVDISEYDEHGHLDILEASKKIYKALDIEKTTKKFYTEYASQRLEFVELIEGIEDDKDRKWYASVLLNRLMFVYFLQRKGFINNGDLEYLQNHLDQSKKAGKDKYYSDFLKLLFFEGFAKPEEKRSEEAKRQLGKIRYLNGGLFLPHQLEEKWPAIHISDKAFENILLLFGSYSWNLNDTPGGNDNEINPDVLGYIFEKYINQKAFGAYYTRPEITEYLCEHTISKVILDRVNVEAIPGVIAERKFESINELYVKLDARLCKELIHDVLPKLKILDPACGSGAFLVAAMRTLIEVYSAIIGKIEFLADPALLKWAKDIRVNHPSLAYFIKKEIITHNLYGVDIMPEAAEIAKLRLFLALVASVQTVEQLEPLPNIDFNLLTGNSLIGLLRVDETAFNKQFAQGNFFQKTYQQLVDQKKIQLETYRDTVTFHEDLHELRDTIEREKEEAYTSLNDLLLNEYTELQIKIEQSTWDEKKKQEGKSQKRAVQIRDIEKLTPFHWGYEFDDVMNTQGGFDAIITNPPWDIFKPNGKEFFQDYSDLVSKKKMAIEDFENHMSTLLQNTDIRQAWFDYQDQFPHVSTYYRSAKQYENQISIVDGKKQGTDINLYKLFIEQCFNLLRLGGSCGMVVPSGIHTDLGTFQLRKMLFENNNIEGLFGFENRKGIFEGVHKSFKFDILTYQKGGETVTFPTAFMRHEVSELAAFPGIGSLNLPVSLIKRLSPDSWSIMEFKSEMDIQIAEKMLKYPLLGDEIDGNPYLKLAREFDMTNDSNLFKTSKGPGRLPLYEGKMIWQFDPHYAEPRYWINEIEGRKTILGKESDGKQILDYEVYRFGFRDISASTNERGMVCSFLPKNIFAGNTIITNISKNNDGYEKLLFTVGIFNSFVFDWLIRKKITSHLNMYIVYQMPCPRFESNQSIHQKIVSLSVKLVCSSDEFDLLAKSVGLNSYKDGVTNPIERAGIRAELDAMIAHLYGLTEEEFAHVLSTFPIVKDEVKQSALREFRKGG